MRRSLLAIAVAVLLFSPRAGAGFDVATGTAVIPEGALGFGFEPGSAATLRAVDLAQFGISDLGDGSFVDGGIEGTRALRVTAGKAVLAGAASDFASVADARVVLSFWGKSEGARPTGRLVYTRQANLAANDVAFPVATIEAIETGRATNDGWVEYSTGPVDARIGTTVAIGGVVFEAEESTGRDTAFLVDGVEIVRAGDRPTRADVCTLATEDAACGAEGACLEGSCFDGALVWGALPTREQRLAIVRRQEQYFVRFTSDRYGAALAASTFVSAALAAAESATTPRAFWQPFHRTAIQSRGAHTRAAGPTHPSRLGWQFASYVRSQWNELLACFNLAERDLDGGGTGFAVFQAAPLSPLHVGDVVTKIDGEDPRAWLARAVTSTGLSSDPDVDDALLASSLQEVVPTFARTLELTRCASAGSCVPVNVDLVAARKNAATLPFETQPKCSLRFQLGIVPPAGADPGAYETAFEGLDQTGHAYVFTNGEPPGTALAAVVDRAFDRGTSTMIVDKRRGDGGGGESLLVWARRVRQDPTFRLLSAARWGHEALDPPAPVFAELSGCADGGDRTTPACWAMAAQWWGVPAPIAPRPAKIAWLNWIDGSASDLTTTFAKGVPGVRIFGPARTMGLFGSLHHLPRFASGMGDGYVQRSDTRIGRTWAEITSAPWHSGRGIEPDERIVQKVSDLVAGRDTLLDRARAWLAE